MLGRYSSAIRAACANERSCGSVRGAISDDRPYRDRWRHSRLWLNYSHTIRSGRARHFVWSLDTLFGNPETGLWSLTERLLAGFKWNFSSC